jgi:hypothetical protein
VDGGGVGGGGGTGVGVTPLALTVREKVLVRVIPPPIPVTVTVCVPTVAEALAESVRVEVQVGVQEGEEKDAVTPVGSPETLSATLCPVPEERFTEILLVTVLPWVTVRAPPVPRLKSKVGGGVVTVTLTDCCPTFPAPSMARAMMVCPPEGAFQVAVYGLVVSVPTTTPPTKNSTLVIPDGSLADAVMVTLCGGKEALFAGVVILTTGAVVSGTGAGGGTGVGGGMVPEIDSYAPISHTVPCGRDVPK